ncbi:LuxR C-terminal-related transcriptional regulator [Planctomycetes bacterium K23_9]|uniref:Transcriptional regulatory protein TdiR n=1 Tax=Stieleria marina TaxID=1930275 RepID=A0A517NMQ0_9BACT|nr:Transcriptional regulatory protein TdiR [Planctomycetes bacterium K23_9]
MADQNRGVFIYSRDEEWSEVSRDIVIGDGYISRIVASTTELVAIAKQFTGEACVLVDCTDESVDVGQLYQSLSQNNLPMPMVLMVAESQMSLATELTNKFACLVMLKETGLSKQRQAINAAFGRLKLVDHQMAVQRNHGRLTQLSERERSIVDLVVEGAPNKQIANKLGLSIKTIERVRQSAYRKLEVRSTAEMTRAVILGDLHDIVRADIPATPVFAPVVPAPFGASRNFVNN